MAVVEGAGGSPGDKGINLRFGKCRVQRTQGRTQKQRIAKIAEANDENSLRRGGRWEQGGFHKEDCFNSPSTNGNTASGRMLLMIASEGER